MVRVAVEYVIVLLTDKQGTQRIGLVAVHDGSAGPGCRCR